MLRIAVCDDDALFAEETAGRVAAILKDKTEYTVSKFTSAGQLLASGPQDIVLLDIEMQGLDGMEAARRLRARGDACRLIFLTSHPRYVFAAFDVEASHYLTKPVEPKKLREVLLRLTARVSEEALRCIAVRQGAGLLRIPLSDILYLEVVDRKVFLHTAEATYDFYGKLEQLEQEFPEGFFRCHRSYIVQFSHIRRYDQAEITLVNGERIPISKRKYQMFCHAFLQYLKKDGELL